jgi:hypothetical protein
MQGYFQEIWKNRNPTTMNGAQIPPILEHRDAKPMPLFLKHLSNEKNGLKRVPESKKTCKSSCFEFVSKKKNTPMLNLLRYS